MDKAKLKQETDKWYKKLKEEKFNDIEQRDGNLKSWSTRVFSGKMNGVYWEDKKSYYESVEAYYRLATHFLYDHKFKNRLERKVWELHADGVSILDIVSILTKKRFKNIYAKKIHEIIKKIAKEMKG